MRKKVTPVDELTAAYLRGVEGRSQAQIAQLLGLSAPLVSRMIDAARRKNYLLEELRFVADRVDPAAMAAVRERLSRSHLTEQLAALSRDIPGRRAPTVRVFQMPENVHGSEHALAAFAAQAAPSVRDLLVRSRLCGVTWGMMLLNIIRELGKRRGPRAGSLDVIPLAGEPLGNEPTTSSSSTLASELARMMTGDDDYHARSLTMVPALVPSDFAASERRAVYKLVERLPDYGAIFGEVESRGADTLAARLDCILTSVGRRPLGFSRGPLLEEPEEQLFVGDMGGVLFRRADLRRDEEKRAAAVEARWTGLRLEHVQACAQRAANATGEPSAPPGVVLVSMGPDRAVAVLEAVKRGLVNHLIIDSRLASTLSQQPALREKRARGADMAQRSREPARSW